MARGRRYLLSPPRLFFFVLINLLLASCAVPASPQIPPHSDPGAYRPGELLVKFNAAVSAERIAEINAAEGAVVVRYLKRISVYHVKLTGGRSVEEAVRSYGSRPEVEYAEPDYLRRALPDASPDDETLMPNGE